LKFPIGGKDNSLAATVHKTRPDLVAKPQKGKMHTYLSFLLSGTPIPASPKKKQTIT